MEYWSGREMGAGSDENRPKQHETHHLGSFSTSLASTLFPIVYFISLKLSMLVRNQKERKRERENLLMAKTM